MSGGAAKLVNFFEAISKIWSAYFAGPTVLIHAMLPPLGDHTGGPISSRVA